MASILEQQRKTALSIQQNVRKGLISRNQDKLPSEDELPTNENTQKARLEILKGAARLGASTINKQGGAIAGEVAGGALGSIVPFVGTTVGAFLGRFLGKRLGVTGIIIVSILLAFMLIGTTIILLIIFLKSYCSMYPGWLPIGFVTEICKSIGS